MEKHEHYGHRSRLRERVRYEGLDHFQDYQVLEYVLSFAIPYKDTNPIAHKLIRKFGSFKNVLEASCEELQKVEGLGEATAQYLSTLTDIFNFYSKQANEKNVLLTSPKFNFDYFKNVFKGKIVEEFYVALLAPNGRLVSCHKVGEGNAVEVKLATRSIAKLILDNKVHNVIIAHNHPRGDASPSEADDALTEALTISLAVTQSKLLDHIIIGEGDTFYSYRLDKKMEHYWNMVKGAYSDPKVAQKFVKYGGDND